MKKICLLLLCTANLLPAQKIVKKSFVNPEIKAISIDATNNFELFVETAKGEELVIEADIEGEYRNDLLLNVRQSGNTLVVNTGFQPNFESPNDKLSAHKVISVALKILLPKDKMVRIFGTNCNVSARGSYRNLKITLSDGSCVLDQIAGSATVATQSGAITVAAARADITAKSKYGEVRGDRIPDGENRYDLGSVTGNILLNKTD